MFGGKTTNMPLYSTNLQASFYHKFGKSREFAYFFVITYKPPVVSTIRSLCYGHIYVRLALSRAYNGPNVCCLYFLDECILRTARTLGAA